MSAESPGLEPTGSDPSENPIDPDDLHGMTDPLSANEINVASVPAEAGDLGADSPPGLAWTAAEPQRIPPASTTYRISKSVIGSGGGPKASTHYIMNSTQGQSTNLSRRQSASYVLVPGYWGRWIPLVYDFDVYLPVVTRDY
jgi:hypothetical protein